MLLVLAGCGHRGSSRPDASDSTAPTAPAASAASTGLVRWPVPVSLSGDEQDDVDASPDGRWWLVSSYAGETDYRIDTVAGAVTERRDRDDDRPNHIDAHGTTSRVDPGNPGDVLIDRADGYELRQRRGTVVLRGPGTTAYRRIATGYPVPGPELAYPASLGTVSDGGRYVTLPTTTAYAAGDTGHGLDVYQLDRRTGRWTRVSRRGYRPTGGVCASPSGRYVAFDARLPGATPSHDHAQAVRWDRAGGAVAVVSLTPDGAPGDGDASGALSVDDAGSVSFVSGATDLVPGEQPGESHLFTAPRPPG